MTKCPCKSDKLYEECCARFISGEKKPATALELMRSRYTAYTKAEVDYLESTHDSRTRQQFEADNAKKWAESSEWLGFEVLETEAGGEEDSEGMVEFIARYKEKKEDAEEITHHEKSYFRKENNTWYFTDGKVVGFEPIVNEEDKVGRNDSCPCGSGKKYKKCCAT